MSINTTHFPTGDLPMTKDLRDEDARPSSYTPCCPNLNPSLETAHSPTHRRRRRRQQPKKRKVQPRTYFAQYIGAIPAGNANQYACDDSRDHPKQNSRFQFDWENLVFPVFTMLTVALICSICWTGHQIRSDNQRRLQEQADTALTASCCCDTVQCSSARRRLGDFKTVQKVSVINGKEGEGEILEEKKGDNGEDKYLVELEYQCPKCEGNCAKCSTKKKKVPSPCFRKHWPRNICGGSDKKEGCGGSGKKTHPPFWYVPAELQLIYKADQMVTIIKDFGSLNGKQGKIIEKMTEDQKGYKMKGDNGEDKYWVRLINVQEQCKKCKGKGGCSIKGCQGEYHPEVPCATTQLKLVEDKVSAAPEPSSSTKDLAEVWDEPAPRRSTGNNARSGPTNIHGEEMRTNLSGRVIGKKKKRRLLPALEQLLHSGSRRLAALAAPCWDVTIWCLKLLLDLILVGLIAACFIALYRCYLPKNRRDFVLPSYQQDLAYINI